LLKKDWKYHCSICFSHSKASRRRALCLSNFEHRILTFQSILFLSTQPFLANKPCDNNINCFIHFRASSSSEPKNSTRITFICSWVERSRKKFLEIQKKKSLRGHKSSSLTCFRENPQTTVRWFIFLFSRKSFFSDKK
jgi:hypothetical protein